MNFRRGHTAPPDDSIDLTSLLDVIFILLIFFLVTASFTQTEDQSMPVDLPQGSHAGEIEAQEELTVFIQEDGTATFRIRDEVLEEDIPPEELVERLRTVRESHGQRPLFLRGDENVRYGEVVRVLDASRDAGFTKVFNIVRGKKSN